jgi:hypothetical protein
MNDHQYQYPKIPTADDLAGIPVCIDEDTEGVVISTARRKRKWPISSTQHLPESQQQSKNTTDNMTK